MRPKDGRNAGETKTDTALECSESMPSLEGRAAPYVAGAVWAFVCLGVAIRIVRYAVNYPLWSDEAFVAANLIGRDYLGLLRPLDYGQLCPVLFLWAERALVGVLGFSEWTLRLCPLICGILALLLFRRAAGSVTRGLPLLLAVGVFAVSAALVRFACEVKPFACDLLAALLLLTPALAWLSERERTRWLWALAAAAPLALGLSHPAVFVAGGVSLGVSVAVWRSGRRSALIPFLAFNLATAACFLTMYLLIMRPQAAAMAEWRQSYWGSGFPPPLSTPLALIRWLVDAHTGKMLGYPGGGDRGLSTPTFLLASSGAVVLWRRGQRSVVAALLSPFGLTLLAAAMHKYPYGNTARHMQFIAPAICLLTGIGAAALIEAMPRPKHRLVATWLLALALAAGGMGMAIRYVAHPFNDDYDVKAREFAKRFWPEQARGAEVACMLFDLGVYNHQWVNLYRSMYLCNQMIYSPPRRQGQCLGAPRFDVVSALHPLRCVLYQGSATTDPEVVAWLAAMKSRFDLRRTEHVVADMSRPIGPKLEETIVVFEFIPRTDVAVARSASPETARR